jgi:2-furoyl-CoA dehydrogenase 2Fe-2S iron sulfur subunit
VRTKTPASDLDGDATRSCLLFAVQADGRRVDTVEGLAGADGQTGTENRLSALQEAFRRHHALQCGFCTAGILMTLDDYLQNHRDPSEADIRAVLSGHLCRCTGYAGIVRAALEIAAAKVDDV